MGMKRFLAIALVMTGLTLPVSAQRGGARGVSAGHSAVGFTGGSSRAFAPSARYSLGTAPQFNARPATATPGFRVSPGSPGRRPVYPGHRRPVYGVGIPYSVGWIAPDTFGYADPGFYDSGDSDPGVRPNDPVQESYPPQAYEGAPYPEPPAPNDASRPGYSAAPAPAPEPESLDAVTLVFKDGRPSQQIHNYLLTRSTLYVRDQQRREIPVDELDVEAMQKTNRAAGVEFQLPGEAR